MSEHRFRLHRTWTVALVVVVTVVIFHALLIETLFIGYAKLSPVINPSAGQECLKRLEESGVPFRTLALSDADLNAGCYVPFGVLVHKSATPFYLKGGSSEYSFFTSCLMATKLIDFERSFLQPAALQHFKQKIKQIRTLGSYSCRKQRSSSLPSDHGFGFAIDLTEFELEDGTVIPVKDYTLPNSFGYHFLQQVSIDACSKFGTILTPLKDQAHADHFHISIGLFGKCL